MKANVYKRIAAATATVLLATSLMACSSSDDSSTATADTTATTETASEEAEATSSEPVTLSVMMQQSRVYPGLEAMIEKLEEEENIIFDMQILPDDEYKSVLQMKLNSGEAPDLIDYNTNNFVDLNPNANLYDLSDTTWAAELINPDVVTYDDKIYAFPFQERNGIGSIIYNMDVFEEYGLEIPTNEEEFYAVCDALVEVGVTPILMSSDTWVPQMWINYEFPKALGGEEELAAFGEALVAGEVKVTDYPELAAVIDTYLDMFTQGYVNADYTTATYDSILTKMGSGEGAMIYGYSAVLSSLDSSYPDTNFGAFNLIVDSQAADLLASPAFSISFMVSADTDKIDTINKVFELWSTAEYGNLWFEENAGFPAFEGIDGGEQNESQLALYEEYLEKDALVSELYTYIPELSPINSTSLWLLILDAPSKGYTGMEVLELYQADIEEYMYEQQAPGYY